MTKILYTVAFLLLSVAAKAQFNNDCTMNGTTDYIQIPASSSLALSGDATVEGRIRLSSANETGYMFINCIQPDNWGVFLAVLNGYPSGAVVIGGVQYTVIGSTALLLNTYHSLAIVRNGTTLTLYVNGVSAASTSVPSGALRNSSTSVSRMGYIQDGTNVFLGGRLDDVRVWSDARTATEVLTNMNTELVGNESNLVAYYKLNETGAGANITVANSATATGTSLDGLTVGTSTTPIFSAVPPIVSLPVELISFTAQNATAAVNLNWATASEKGTHMFVIERSSNGTDYSSIISVNAGGYSDGNRQYEAVDQKPLAGPSFYRLKMLDFDGTFSYSNISRVTRTAASVRTAVLQSPVDGTLSLQQDAGVTGVSITDMNGRTIVKYAANAGGTYDVSPLAPGIYSVHVLSASGVETIPMVKR